MTARAGQSVPSLVAEARQARASGRVAASLALFEDAAALQPDNPWLGLEAAHDLRVLGRTAEAEAAYLAALPCLPNQAPALLGLALCARNRGDLPASLDLHARVVAADPAHVWGRLGLAQDLRELDRIAEAEAEYARVLAADPLQWPALLGLGQCARRRGDRMAALEWHRRAFEAGHDTWCGLEYATDLRELGRLDDARATLLAALATAPDHPALLSATGATERQAGRHEQALAAFARVHDVQPGRAEPLLQMALEERALGRPDACDARLDQALTLEPDNAGVLAQQAEQARLAGDIARMNQVYAQAVARLPGHLRLALGYAESLTLLGRLQDALDHLTASAARHSGRDAQAILLKRIGLLRRTGHWFQALDLAETATASCPDDFDTWMERLACESLVGTDAATDASLAQARPRTPPEHARFARWRAERALERHNPEAAAARCRDALSAEPDDAETYRLMARVALTALDLPGARTALQNHVRAGAAPIRQRGGSLNISQTRLGQLLDEYTLDRQTVAAVMQARADLPPTAQADAMLGLARASPDSTAAAIAVIGALRPLGLAGPAARPADATPNEPIPRVVVQFWDAADVPADVKDMMASWRDQNPAFDTRVFDDANARAFIAAAHGALAARIYARVKQPAQKAHMFRLAYLSAAGGVYADADSRCLGGLATILPPGARLVLHQGSFGAVATDFIAASARHPVLVRAFRLAMQAVARGDEDVPWLSTGPALLTRALAQILSETGSSWPRWFETTSILDRHQVSQFAATQCWAGYKATPKTRGRTRSPAS